MNRIHLILICLLLFAGTSRAQVQSENRKFSLSLGAAVFTNGTDAFWGGALAFDFMLSPKHRLAVEIRGGADNSRRIGSYGYTITTQNASGQTIDSETFNDGEISYGYNLTDVMISWNRLFALSEKWTFRVGPSIGFLSVNGSDSYSPTYYEGTEIEGLPESQMESKYAFTGGLTAGLRWSFARRWYLDMSYRLSANTGVLFPQRSMNVLGQRVSIESREFGLVGNCIGLSLGWRF